MRLCRTAWTRSLSFLKPIAKSMEREFECSVGISSYIADHSGFKGILKQRFNDFVVREIIIGGEVSHLRSTTLSQELQELEDKHFKLADTGVEDIDKVLDAVKALELVKLRASDKEIRSFFEKCIRKDIECPQSLILCYCDDKQQRSAVHQAVKQSYAVG